MTAKEKILVRLAEARSALAIHELNIEGVSQTSASARLREMARDGIVRSVPVPGKKYTAWVLTPHEIDLFGRVLPGGIGGVLGSQPMPGEILPARPSI